MKFWTDPTLLAVALLLTICVSFAACAREEKKPNIVFFLVDDLGWTDTGCYGSSYYDTPHIDQLAKEGMKFTSAYMMPTCSPSRASLMTGKYPPRTGIYTVDAYAGTPLKMQKVKGIRSKRFISADEVTLAEVLKEAGYATGHFGKWHLGNDSLTGPLGQGFDINMGGDATGSPKSFFSPFGNIKHMALAKEGEYLTEILADGACRFIEENKNTPFFLYFPFYQVHVPLHAKKEWVKKYKGKKKYEGQGVPAYGAMVSYMDHSIGRVLDQLEKYDLLDNTIIIFTSDNGGQIVATSNSPLRGQKGNLTEGGIRVPFIVKWPGVVRPGSIEDTPVTVVDHYPTLAEMAGTGIPENTVVDGVSLVPLLQARGKLKRDAIYWHLTSYNGNGRTNALLWQYPGGAIRKGDWKLIENFEEGSLRLYNLKEDIGETEDLYDQYPEKAGALLAELRQWRKNTGAPVPNETNPHFEAGSRDWIVGANRSRDVKETERLTLVR